MIIINKITMMSGIMIARIIVSSSFSSSSPKPPVTSVGCAINAILYYYYVTTNDGSLVVVDVLTSTISLNVIMNLMDVLGTNNSMVEVGVGAVK